MCLMDTNPLQADDELILRSWQRFAVEPPHLEARLQEKCSRAEVMDGIIATKVPCKSRIIYIAYSFLYSGNLSDPILTSHATGFVYASMWKWRTNGFWFDKDCWSFVEAEDDEVRGPRTATRSSQSSGSNLLDTPKLYHQCMDNRISW